METIEKLKADKLRELGFERVSNELLNLAAKKRKLALAYEHYRFVRQEKIDAFNAKLKEQTKYISNGWTSYKKLYFTSIKDYPDIPPDHVLDSLVKAKEINCFDYLEIAYIFEVKDPILFGRIGECSDRFFIDQWDEDVKIEDILMPNEG